MSLATKSEFYRYSARTVAYGILTMCTHKMYAYPVPPRNALSLERLFMHIALQFDSGTPSADRVLEAVGIASEFPSISSQAPRTLKQIDVNESADADRKIDFKIDLTTLLTKTNVTYTDEVFGDYEQDNMTLVYLKFPDTLATDSSHGIIELWKIDTEWTTQEIR